MEQTAERKENKMGIMPVGRLLFQMSLPMVISMVIQALYNIVDSMYVSQINEDALTAVSLVYPMQTLMIAIATGTGVGINALLSRSLGRKDYETANSVALHGVSLALISGVLFSAASFLLAEAFMGLQTSDPEIFAYGVTYMRICCTLCFGVFLQITMERLLTSTGRTLLTMFTQGLGAVINIILDPLLLIGQFGAPEMGVAGAAAATVIGQFCGFFLGLFFNLKLNREIRLNFRGFRLRASLTGEIYKIAVPSIIMQCISSVMTFGMNLILLQFSSTAAAVFGIYFKLNSFIFMPIFGLNNGMVPIIAYNYGARKRLRINRAIRLSAVAATLLMLAGLALFCVIPEQLLGIFNASGHMLAIGVPAMRVISLSFIVAGCCIVLSSVLQALGSAFYSMLTSLIRQLIVLLPAAWLLAETFGLPAVWWSFPIAEIFSLLFTVLFFRRVYRQKIRPLPEDGGNSTGQEAARFAASRAAER